MIRMNKLNNVERFLKLTREAHGDVLINFPDGTKCSLRNDHTAREMLRALPVDNADLMISLTDREDLPVIMEFMMEDCA